jgi:hypothetical protein
MFGPLIDHLLKQAKAKKKQAMKASQPKEGDK